MAEIDKGLPNVKRPEDELVEEETLEEVDIADQLGKKPIEVPKKMMVVLQLILIQMQCRHQKKVTTLQI